MGKSMYSTFKAAELLGVSPDTVLKWIKAGKIPARRTLGGHYRIRKSIVDDLLSENSWNGLEQTTPKPKTHQFCWEFHAQRGKSIDACKSCLVYLTRAQYCYEMKPVPKELGYMRHFCESECEDCDYYHYVKDQPRRNDPPPSESG